jgi:molybdopterin-guanine dinucleotide biosynthesis protein A
VRPLPDRDPNSPDASPAGIILAGGTSTRFGQDKCHTVWRQQRLVDHVAGCLRGITDRIVVVVQPDQVGQDWPADRVVTDDPALPAGPLRGIIAGLAACERDFAWVVACDTPCLVPDLLLALRATAAPGDMAVVPVWRERLQPLVAYYARAAAAPMADVARTGEARPRTALAAVGFRRFPAEACRRHDPDGLSFFNLNRPGDLDELEQVLDGDASPDTGSRNPRSERNPS